MAVRIVQPRTVNREFSVGGCIRVRANSLAHGKRARGRHGLAAQSGVGAAVSSSPFVRRTFELKVRNAVFGQKLTLRIIQDIWIKFLGTAAAGLTWAPVEKPRGITVIGI